MSGSLTLESLQGIVTVLLISGEEAITVEEVGPLHVDGLEGKAASCAHGIAGGAAGQQCPVALAAWRQHGAAQHADVRVALSSKQRLHHAEEQVLSAQLRLLAAPVAQQTGEQGLSVGHVIAVGQQHVGACC